MENIFLKSDGTKQNFFPKYGNIKLKLLFIL